MANIRIEQMTPTQKVAALLITLGPSAASEIMKNIEDDNALEQITIEIAGLSKLPQEVIEAIVDEFHTVFQASSMLAAGVIPFSAHHAFKSFPSGFGYSSQAYPSSKPSKFLQARNQPV